MFKKVTDNMSRFLKDAFEKTAAFFKGLTLVKRIGVIASVVLVVATVAVLSCFRTAVKVVYNGQVVGCVASVSEAEAIKSAVIDDAKRRGTAELNFEFKKAFVFRGHVNKVDLVATAAISNTVITDSNLHVAGLYLDGELVAVADTVDKMQSALDSFKAKYVVGDMVFDGFSREVSITELTVMQSDCPQFIDTVEELEALNVELRVKTYRTEEYDQTIKYTTKYTYDSSKDKSYKNTTVAGVNGLAHIVAKVYYVNGEQVSSETLSSKTVKEAVNAKVTVGSKNTTFTDIKERLDALNAENDGSRVTFIFPLEIRSSGYISSYWGDGRNHKGMDFASPKGTDIYAVADGVVTISKYSDSYGYYIEIKHKDGSRTRYAHASKLLVKVGQTVKQGDHIAEVGTTGRSTGNHLHFEVIVNGERVNPAPYLAIK